MNYDRNKFYIFLLNPDAQLSKLGYAEVNKSNKQL